MDRDRPYLANYAIGFLVVMSMFYFYEALVFYVFAEVIDKNVTAVLAYADALLFLVIAGFAISAMLIMSSKLGYLVCIPMMVFLIVTGLLSVGDLGKDLDLLVNTLLSLAILVILLTPEVRCYYMRECPMLPEFRGTLRA